ncbi:MAG: hypothetical protein U1F63_05645 [Chitinivorax sp.]
MRAILTVVLGMSLALPVLADRYRADDGRSIETGPGGAMTLDDGAGNKIRIRPDGSMDVQGEEGRVKPSPDGEPQARRHGKTKSKGFGNTQSRNIGCQIGADGVYRNCQQKQ